MTVKRTHEIYRIYGHNGALLYVGRSLNTIARASQHRVTKSWWDTVTRIDIERFVATDDVAQAREAIAIATEKPIHNVMHNMSQKAEPLPLTPGQPLPPPMAHQRIKAPVWARERRPHLQAPQFDDLIAASLGDEPISARMMAKVVGCSHNTANNALHRLAAKGKARRADEGWIDPMFASEDVA